MVSGSADQNDHCSEKRINGESSDGESSLLAVAISVQNVAGMFEVLYGRAEPTGPQTCNVEFN